MTYAEEAEKMIRKYNPKLAEIFKSQPFNRCTIAKAFTAGFKSEDGLNYGNLVEKLAKADMIERRLASIA